MEHKMSFLELLSCMLKIHFYSFLFLFRELYFYRIFKEKLHRLSMLGKINSMDQQPLQCRFHEVRITNKDFLYLRKPLICTYDRMYLNVI